MQKDKFPTERREYPRFKDNIFILGNVKASSPEEFKALACNISACGLMFETERDISVDNKFGFEMYQPIDRDKRRIFSIPVSAKVVWIRKIEKDNFEQGENKYKVGIKFLKILKEDRQRIAKYVEENISER